LTTWFSQVAVVEIMVAVARVDFVQPLLQQVVGEV
jgi:hypothetical protein